MESSVSRQPANTLRSDQILHPIARLAICAVVVLAVIGALSLLHVADRPFAGALILFLPLVLIVSVYWGARYAIWFSVLAALGFSWLIPPAGHFHLLDSRVWALLAGCLVSGLVASSLADRLRQAVLDAEQRRAQAVAAHQRFADLVNSVEGIVWEADAETLAFSFVSEQAERVLGYPLDQWLNQSTFWKDHLHPEDRELGLEVLQRAAMEKRDRDFECRLIAAGGSVVWVRCLVTVIAEEGLVKRLRGVMVDVSARRRAEVLLAGENRLLEMIATGAPLKEILKDLCLMIEQQRRGTLASIMLLNPDGVHLDSVAGPNLPDEWKQQMEKLPIGPCAGSCGTAVYKGSPVIACDIATDPVWEVPEHRASALKHGLRASWSSPVVSAKGQVLGTFCMYYREPRAPDSQDLELIDLATHVARIAIGRDRAQKALLRSECYLKEAQRISRTGSWAWDVIADKGLYFSEETFRVFGLDPQRGTPPEVEEFLGLLHPEDRDTFYEHAQTAIREKTDLEEDYRVVLPDGTIKYVHEIGHPVLDQTGEVTEYVGTVADVTDRKRAEDELRAAETRFRTYVDHATDALFVQYEQGYIADVNRQACESLGYRREELLGMSPRDFDAGPDPAVFERVARQLETDEICNFETVHRRKDGSVFPVEVRVRRFWNGSRPFFLSLARDISERKRAEGERDKLRQLEADLAHINRVSMMGELAASLGHEIKQPIAAAVTNANTCRRWLEREQPDLKEARDAAQRMIQDTMRAAEIINHTSSLFKKGALQREPVNLNELVNEIAALLRNEARRSNVSIRRKLAADLPPVVGDRVQLQQVLMNLMINAIEAMKGIDGTRELSLGSKRDDQNGVTVSVTDTGIGLPSETNHLFDAFHTTKLDGTGMGLAISRSIIESHGGHLSAIPESGRGATFYFTLPAADGGHS
jgi:PAS domain S-box-containing protein